MRRLAIRILSKAIRILTPQSKEVVTPEVETPATIQAKRVVQWFKDEGDKTHRMNYRLGPESLVIDLGGYEGQWSSDLYAMHNSNIWIFEPYRPFADNIEKRFGNNPKIKVFKFGLGKRSEFVDLTIMDNSSSIHQTDGEKTSIEIVSITDFINDHNIQKVDLIKINIEGAEYELLEEVLDAGLVNRFENIQVQFHDFIIDNAEVRMKKIQERLSKSHRLTYYYEFVWENWERIN